MATQARIDKGSLKGQFLRSSYLQQKGVRWPVDLAFSDYGFPAAHQRADVSMLTWKQVANASKTHRIKSRWEHFARAAAADNWAGERLVGRRAHN
ncbi:MAG: hypothetical protein J0I79_16645 [Mesorhizobium sp.]|uniref:hypothetical protein n=1 Tax=Mesorhizobium sp. TaxID=1871066 RepID=UPI001AC31BAD|nr:hypothetical protein [Mesorhizobium sp.]MBN9219576.1 hypothetical protein [Mesorhizobium sp.]